MTTIPTSILIKKASLEYDKTANRFLEPYKISNSQFKLLKYLFSINYMTGRNWSS
jgi:hypothetical protein